jgi:hypothetical protein
MTNKSYKVYADKAARMLCLGWAVLLLAFPSAARANAIIGDPVDWDDNEPSEAWAALGSSATVIENTAGADDFLQITFPGGIDPGPGPQWYETVTGPSVDLFALTWETDYWVEFDFWADSVLPDTLQVRWGADGSGRTWANDVTPSGVGSWQTLKTDTFSSFENWKLSPLVDQDDFLADLGSIDWIGVYIFRDGTDEEIYGVDDFKLMVPEPAEYLMLAAALLTAFLVMRRQKLLPVPVKIA